MPYNPELRDSAKALRKAANLSEVLFWNQVKQGKFKGLDFDRQKIIGNYIVDFFCVNCGVVIEIDGISHDEKEEYDAKRDDFLRSLDLVIIRIPVIHILQRMEETMEWLKEHKAFEGW
ncbi:MAG TPA: DUF559 domain-containing protein [Ginsengibacter sp.]|nr:DUF559 domain-containing protein [Ginsengibacter sp.]